MNRFRSRSTALILFVMSAAAGAESSVLPKAEEHLDPLLKNIGLVVLFSVIGLIMFGFSFLLMNKFSPFSIRKEIEEDQNTALAILMGSVILGIAIIVAAAIHG